MGKYRHFIPDQASGEWIELFAFPCMLVVTLTRRSISLLTVVIIAWWRRRLFFDFLKVNRLRLLTSSSASLSDHLIIHLPLPRLDLITSSLAPFFLCLTDTRTNGKPLLCHDEKLASRCRLKPEFSAKLSHVLKNKDTKSQVLIRCRDLFLTS